MLSELFRWRASERPVGSADSVACELHLRRTLIRYTAAYWGAFYGLATLRSIANMSPYLVIQAYQRLIMVTLGFALCMGMMRLLMRRAAEPWARQVAVALSIAACASIVYFVTNYFVFYVTIGLEPKVGTFAKISLYFIEFFWVFPGWCLLYFVTVSRSAVEVTPGTAEVDSIWVNNRGIQQAVRLELITWVQSEGDYVRICTKDRSYQLRATMTQMESELGAERFIRLHRQTIAARSLIEAVVRHADGRVIARLAGGDELPIGRTYVRRVREALGSTACRP